MCCKIDAFGDFDSSIYYFDFHSGRDGNGEHLLDRRHDSRDHQHVGDCSHDGGDGSMIRVVIEVDAPSGQAIGIKEDLAQYLEQFGDARVVDVLVDPGEQMDLKGVKHWKAN